MKKWWCDAIIQLIAMFAVYIISSAFLSMFIVNMFSLDPLMYYIGFMVQFIFMTILLDIYDRFMLTYFEQSFVTCLVSSISMFVGVFVGLSFVVGYSLSFVLLNLSIFLVDRISDRCLK